MQVVGKWKWRDHNKTVQRGWFRWEGCRWLHSLAEEGSLRAEAIAVCMQRWSFHRRFLSWETSFDWSEMKIRVFPGVSSHPAVRTRPGFQIKWTQPDFSWFFMRTIPAAVNRSGFDCTPQVSKNLLGMNSTRDLFSSYFFPVLEHKPNWKNVFLLHKPEKGW